MNIQLIPQLENLKPGSRIVSHVFDMKGVQPDRIVKMTSQEDGLERPLISGLRRSSLKKANREQCGVNKQWRRCRLPHYGLLVSQHNLPRWRIYDHRVQHHLHALHPLLHQLSKRLILPES